ncbi:MAG: 50S ribosomal protein L28 [Alphaproteobacteria bacterium]|nr:50S ribosomal protein L28 [Alphaproteobacteria bacterium]MDD9919918.1 50S ribosomal protein L28 [Alphaproteobacteria bacterium]
MAKVCDITGKRAITGNNVSHSMRHTKRRFLPNLHDKTLFSEVLGQNIRLKLTSNALRTIDKYNGLDNFMLTIKPRKTETFSGAALKVRKTIMKRAAAKAAAVA